MILKLISRIPKQDKTFGGWRIWKKPNSLTRYVIGADVAEGVAKDASVAQVLDLITGEQVACYWNDSIDTDNFAAELYKGGKYYNNAFIIIESNNHGHAVISHLSGQAGGLAYPNLFKRYVYDEFTQKKTKKIGFNTTAATKPFIIEKLKYALRDGDAQVFDKYTQQEINAFVRNDKGKMGAVGSDRDDRVMALALANYYRTFIKDSEKETNEKPIQQHFDPMTGFPLAYD